MLLPLAEERRNIVNLANMLGYKVKPTTPAYTDLEVSEIVDAAGGVNDRYPNWDQAITIDKGMKIQSLADSNIIFETLDIVDFTISGANAPAPVVSSVDVTTGVPDEYSVTRKVKAISGETVTTTFTLGEPEKFIRLTLQ